MWYFCFFTTRKTRSRTGVYSIPPPYRLHPPHIPLTLPQPPPPPRPSTIAPGSTSACRSGPAMAAGMAALWPGGALPTPLPSLPTPPGGPRGTRAKPKNELWEPSHGRRTRHKKPPLQTSSCRRPTTGVGPHFVPRSAPFTPVLDYTYTSCQTNL